MLQTSLFYFISFGLVLSAIGVITCRSAVYSVLCLAAAMCFTGGLFVLLKAYLVATILVLVYAGAILVLFLFVVMMLDARRAPEPRGFSLPGLLALALGAGFVSLAVRVIRTLPSSPLDGAAEGTAKALGLELFGRYLLPFELTAFLLLAAVVSVAVLAKKDPS